MIVGLETYKRRQYMIKEPPRTNTRIYLGSSRLGHGDGLFGFEDYFDQPLCVAAKQAGYDMVILTEMIGKFQIVVEVLNTDSREVCFSKLVYTE